MKGSLANSVGLTPDTYVCVSGVRDNCFSENLVCFVFLLPPF